MQACETIVRRDNGGVARERQLISAYVVPHRVTATDLERDDKIEPRGVSHKSPHIPAIGVSEVIFRD
jgi:hypothetical protein